MRIRSTKPEFWRSERIASVDWEDRLVLKGLESYVDDNGVGKDDIALIVGDLFQRDLVREPSRTLARVSEGISRLHSAGLVWRYTGSGTALLYVSFWESIQRVDKPQAGRFPRPDGTMNYKDSLIRESVAKPREPSRTFAPGTGEQGNRGTEEKDLPDPCGSSDTDPLAHITEADFPDGTFEPIANDYPPAFEQWWEHYPRKTGKRKAFNAWKAARKRATAAELIEGAQRYAADPNRVDQFTKYPEGWLSRDGWLDDALPAANSQHQGPTAYERKTAKNAAVFLELGHEPPHDKELRA